MTIQQLAKQLNIPFKLLEKESLRTFLLTRLGEIEARRQNILKKYTIDSLSDWDEKAREGKRSEGGYKGVVDYFNLDDLDSQKEKIIKDLLAF